MEKPRLPRPKLRRFVLPLNGFQACILYYMENCSHWNVMFAVMFYPKKFLSSCLALMPFPRHLNFSGPNCKDFS